MNWTSILALLPTLISAVGGMLKPTTAPLSGLSGGPATGEAMTTLLQTEEAFIKLAQEALNAVQQLGLVSFGSPLTVDGIAGPHTTAAIHALLAKFNVQV